MRLLVLLAVMGLMSATTSFQVEGPSSGATTALCVGYLLICAYLMGWLAARLGVPKLTGYLLAGLVAGSSGLGLIPASAYADLSVFTGVSVALIALTAGTELEFRTMRPLLRTVSWMTAISGVGTATVLAITVFALRHMLPFMQPLTDTQALALSAVLGVVLSANSPAVVVALRAETQADGPLCRTVLGAVIMADLLVIVLFALFGTLAAGVLGGQDRGNAVAHLAWEIGGSLVAGVGVGAIIWLYLAKVGQSTALFVVSLCFVVAEVARIIGLDPLLVCLTAGVVVRNATGLGHELHRAIEASALPVYLVFFAAAGATIHLDALWLVAIPAATFAVVRAVTFLATARIACRIADAPDIVRRYAGFGLLPQAGLALALGLLVVRTFPGPGEGAGTLVLGIVAINELVMPIVYRRILLRSGEAGRAVVAAAP